MLCPWGGAWGWFTGVQPVTEGGRWRLILQDQHPCVHSVFDTFPTTSPCPPREPAPPCLITGGGVLSLDHAGCMHRQPFPGAPQHT